MVTFASTNQNKYREVQSILSAHNINVDFAQINLVEIQSESLEEIAREKAKNAFSQVGRPVIVEDDGLFIDALGGFPGQYSSHASTTRCMNGCAISEMLILPATSAPSR